MKLRPPAPPGKFYSCDWWISTLGSYHRVASAWRGGALAMEKLGPKGGKWFAVTSLESWRAWAQAFNDRARKQIMGRRAAKVRRALDPEPRKRWY